MNFEINMQSEGIIGIPVRKRNKDIVKIVHSMTKIFKQHMVGAKVEQEVANGPNRGRRFRSKQRLLRTVRQSLWVCRPIASSKSVEE
jgi:hypothetical protein